MKIYKFTILILLLTAQFYCQPLSAQADTLNTAKKNRERVVSPLKATMLAAAFPGLGQVYNRKYYKVPFVYAGFGALGYSIIFNTAKYSDYINAYRELTDDIPETIAYQDLLRAFEPEEIDAALGSDNFSSSASANVKTQLMNGIDYYRRYRDLSYIGVGLWYLISILDANIDANLYDYDVSESLNISVKPVPLSLGTGGTAGIGVTVTF